MNTKRFLSTILFLVFYLSLASQAMEYQLSSGNNFILSDAERIKETKQNTTVSFSKKDLLKTDDSVDSIMIIELPDIGQGTLLLSGKQVNLYQEVPVGKLSKLKFVPVSSTKTGSFCYILKSGDLLGEEVYRMTIKIPAELKTSKLKLETQKNIGINCYVQAGEDSVLDFTKYPKLGTVSVAANGRVICYKPYDNKTGTDSFTFNEINSNGEITAANSIEVKINKPASTICYDDMSESYAAYASIQLAEKNIFTGSTIGDKLLFEPTKIVSRGDFLVMLMKTADAELNASAIGSEEFDDSSIMPQWLKTYVATAAEAGVVSGKLTPEGKRNFDAEANITRAEAAVMMYNAIMPETKKDSTLSFADADTVPTWASQAIVSLSQCGILHGYEDNTIRASQPITREECAAMLYAAIQYSGDRPDGLLNVFSFLNK